MEQLKLFQEIYYSKMEVAKKAELMYSIFLNFRRISEEVCPQEIILKVLTSSKSKTSDEFVEELRDYVLFNAKHLSRSAINNYLADKYKVIPEELPPVGKIPDEVIYNVISHPEFLNKIKKSKN